MSNPFWIIEYVLDVGADLATRKGTDLLMTSSIDQADVEDRFTCHLALVLPTWQKIISVTATRSH